MEIKFARIVPCQIQDQELNSTMMECVVHVLIIQKANID